VALETDHFRKKIDQVRLEQKARKPAPGQHAEGNLGREADLLDNLNTAADSIDRWIGRCYAQEQTIVKLREQVKRAGFTPEA
jgi:hypothetical protein